MEKEIIKQQDIFYEINKNDLTAQVTKSPNARGDIFLPSFIKYESKEYKIINIKEDSFKKNKKIRSITMPDDSYLQSIGKNAFASSLIRNIFIPKSVNKLEHPFSKFIKVTISPSNKNFKYLDDDHQIIIEKSDKTKDVFDTIIFASRDIKCIKIPKHIKYIKQCAFKNCENLRTIEISEDSELVSIGKNSFESTKIISLFIPASFEEFEDGWCKYVEKLTKITISPSNKNFKYLDDEHQIVVGKSDKTKDVFDTIIFASRDIKCIKIPKHIKYIKQCAFENCKNLRIVDIPEDSELISIGKHLFSSSIVEKLFIPARFEEFEDGWCDNTSKLTKVTISQLNKNFKYLDDEHQIIVGKSDNNQDIFDTIIFASRDIKHIKIPKHIKYIKQFAFENCEKLKLVDFEKESELEIIGNYSFSSTSLRKITIPKSVSEICEAAFMICVKLKSVTFEEGSKLVSINESLFEYSSNLKTVTIPENSSLRSIHCNSFGDTEIKELFIPAGVEKIEDGWCKYSEYLVNVVVSPLNKNFKYLDDEHKIIVGKSDINQDIFDTIVFVSHDIIHVKIPSTIKFIYQYSFAYCNNLQEVEFSEESEIVSISNHLFYSSSIKSLFIPASLEEFEDGWCDNTSKLTKVTISPSNKNFKYLDDEHQIIVGKSDNNQDIFDTIIFASRDIKHIKIPKHIKYIKQCAFEYCELKSVEIEKDSELISIGFLSFANSAIQAITIPKNVCELCNSSFFICKDLQNFSLEDGSKLKSIDRSLFFSCSKLKSIGIPKNSSITKICESAFIFSSIEELFIPETVEELEDKWCDYASKLKKVTISPENKNFKYLDIEHKIIVGKSDPSQDIFDVIVFAQRDIKYAEIPAYIKCIKSDAFHYCKKLERINIPDDSEIDSIDDHAFVSTSLINFKFPRKICEYKNDFLDGNQNILYLEFLGEVFIDDENNSIFDTLNKLVLVSFPNVKELSISMERNSISCQKNFKLFINAGSKISFHNYYTKKSWRKLSSSDDYDYF